MRRMVHLVPWYHSRNHPDFQRKNDGREGGPEAPRRVVPGYLISFSGEACLVQSDFMGHLPQASFLALGWASVC